MVPRQTTLLLVALFVAMGGCGSDSPAPAVLDGAAGDGLRRDARDTDSALDDGSRDVGRVDGSRDGASADQAGGDATVDVSLVDGEVFAPSCVACHGSTNPAPPVALDGKTATSARGVGAHQAHLGASTWHVQFYCADCHIVPKTVTAAGHMDTAAPAELTFSSRSGSSASFDGATCANVYCHGATLSGGKFTKPSWTKVDGSQKTCDSCHGMPPSNKHAPTATNCSGCHGSVVDANNKIIAPHLHINGKVEVTAAHPTGWVAKTAHGAAFNNGDSCGGSSCHGGPKLEGAAATTCQKCHPGFEKNCTFCHGGTDNTTGAPPFTVDGKSAASVPGVGRHSSHVWTGGKARYDCSICHVKPTDAFSAGHIDPRPGDVKFSGIAAGTTYNTTTHQCTNIYCHGNGNGSKGSAPWVGAWNNTCSSCHPAKPTSGEHKEHTDEGIGCQVCHNCVVNGQGAINNPALHVDGKKDYCGPKGFNATTKRCSLKCHGRDHQNDPW
jgi:predicted CxxxxCH...CXXCH cytochrome family protein